MDALINGEKQIRCAIYTRKSTEEGLEQEYNTLDAQRDSCEAYIQSQISRGWKILPTHYDDGGFTGANTERPAYNRLIADIKANLVDMVVVYKVDRLSRSLGDFANIMVLFEKHQVGFVSVTQYFDTSSSIGRMTLNILITFAQFEREMISERIRDKISRSRQKGKYMGGQPVLGYNVIDKKLIINKDEKYQIQQIFDFYLNGKSISSIVKTINEYGWTTKQWKTKRGKLSGGKIFNKQILYTILKNPIYIGKVRYHGQEFEGEHDGIISEEVFNNVQILLKNNRINQKNTDHTRIPSMLRGVLYCSSCGSRMVISYTKKKNKKYIYYTCLNAIKNGRSVCKNKSIPSHKMDKFVVQHIQKITTNPTFLTQFIDEYEKQRDVEIENISTEINGFTLKLASYQIERDRLLQVGDQLNANEIMEHIRKSSHRLEFLQSKKIALESSNLNAGDITVILNKFFPIWDQLKIDEQNAVLDKLFEQIFWDSDAESIDFNFSPMGIQLLQNNKCYNYAN